MNPQEHREISRMGGLASHRGQRHDWNDYDEDREDYSESGGSYRMKDRYDDYNDDEEEDYFEEEIRDRRRYYSSPYYEEFPDNNRRTSTNRRKVRE
jgi:hypothetical protein